VYAEARIKHIRELINDEPSQEAEAGTSKKAASASSGSE
jgi:spore germination protein PE